MQEDPIEGWYFEIETNLESQDYKLFRNALTKAFVNPVDGVDCFEVFYNGGFGRFSGGNFVTGLATKYKVLIRKITKDRIYLHGKSGSLIFQGLFIDSLIDDIAQITIFQKNSNYNLSTEPKGVERVLYEINEAGGYKLLRPERTTGGKLVYDKIQNRLNDDLAVGYRVYVPRKTRVQASCVDPATGLTIYSNILEINVELPDIYKSEIHFDNSDENIDVASNLNTMNFISYDPVENNFYFKAEEP